MDQNLSSWLKDHLVLTQMSEAELNILLFHPRHGTLCRRLVKFLAESTLCRHKYPNVYAHEEFAEATDELEKTNESFRETLRNLEQYAKISENTERELIFVKSKLHYLRMYSELQQATIKALEEMSSGSNLAIEQVVSSINDIDYLTNSDLESLYNVVDMNRLENITSRQATAIDEDLSDLEKRIDKIHLQISENLSIVDDKMDEFVGPDLRETKYDNLIALKVPEFDDVIMRIYSEEKVTKEAGDELNKNVSQLNQQVSDLSELYKTKKAHINKVTVEEMKKDRNILDNLHRLCQL